MANPKPWYKKGVRFKCEGTECGDCCSGRWGSGYVWLKMSDIKRLVDHMGISLEEFGQGYVRQVGMGYSLLEQPNNDCTFYIEGKGCSVYDARPDQCRSYPFWNDVIETKERWDGEVEDCPGINQGGEESRFTFDQIEKLRKMHTRGDTDPFEA